MFPRPLGPSQHPRDRNAILKRCILMTMNRRLATEVGRFPPKQHVLLAGKPFALHIDLEMSKTGSTTSSRGSARLKRRRIVVVVVPPIDELDLVGPIQTFSAANRLFGKTSHDAAPVRRTYQS
jgi:hypothetical protein